MEDLVKASRDICTSEQKNSIRRIQQETEINFSGNAKLKRRAKTQFFRRIMKKKIYIYGLENILLGSCNYYVIFILYLFFF